MHIFSEEEQMKKGMTWLAAMAFCVALTAPALAADPVKIGVQGAHSGDLASYGVPSLNATKIVVDEANAKGGVGTEKFAAAAEEYRSGLVYGPEKPEEAPLVYALVTKDGVERY